LDGVAVDEVAAADAAVARLTVRHVGQVHHFPEISGNGGKFFGPSFFGAFADFSAQNCLVIMIFFYIHTWLHF
jgi:hypothetical protein